MTFAEHMSAFLMGPNLVSEMMSKIEWVCSSLTDIIEAVISVPTITINIWESQFLHILVNSFLWLFHFSILADV